MNSKLKTCRRNHFQMPNVDDELMVDYPPVAASLTTTPVSAININSSIHKDEYPDSFNMSEEPNQILNVNDKLVLVHTPAASSVTTMPASAINGNCSIHMDEYPYRLEMPEESIQMMNDELMPDSNLASPDTTMSDVNNNYFKMDDYSDSVDNRIIVGWAVMIILLGLISFSFPHNDVNDNYSTEAFVTYIVMLISELGIWIPLWIHMSPPRGHLKKEKLVLRASFMIFSHVSNIIEQIISSILYLNHGRLLTFIHLFYGVVSFLMVSTLFWLAVDLKRDGLKWEHFSLGCNATLSATLLNISVLQLIMKKNFLHFPLFAILRDVIDLVDLIIRIVHNKEEHCSGRTGLEQKKKCSPTN